MRDLISLEKNILELTDNNFENRPWGKFENILISKKLKIKRITVNQIQDYQSSFIILEVNIGL